MTDSYDTYLRELKELLDTVRAADHTTAQADSQFRQRIAHIEQETRKRVVAIQSRASEAAASYGRTVRRLSLNPVSRLGIRFPEKVRPDPSVGQGIDELTTRQETLEEKLIGLIQSFEARERNAQSAGDSAGALAARRALLEERSSRNITAPTQSETPKLESAVQPEPRIEKIPNSSGENNQHTARFLRNTVLAFVAVCLPTFLLIEPLTALAASLIASNITGAVITWIAKVDPLSHLIPKAVISLDKTALRTSASETGQISGFEPKALQHVQIPKNNILMFGKPGRGLASSDFDSAHIKAGQQGEINFCKALAKAGLLDRFATFWSIHMLDRDNYSRLDADVDCAIITGTTIWLIDLKYYLSGNVIYRNTDDYHMEIIDAPTGARIGDVRKLSSNMKMAIERFGQRYQYYDSLRIAARVVLVPTEKGVGKVDSVFWPGKIPLVTLPDFLKELQSEPAFSKTLDSDLVLITFKNLVKSD